MTLRTPTGPIGALLESLVAPSLPFRAPLGLEIWASDRALGGPIRALGAPVRVSGPLLGYRGISHERGQKLFLCEERGGGARGGAHTIFFSRGPQRLSPALIIYIALSCNFMVHGVLGREQGTGRNGRMPVLPSGADFFPSECKKR